MNKIINGWLLSTCCLILTLGSVTSCKKNNDVDSGRIQLLSFGPTGSKHGDTLRFVGVNLNQVTAIEFTGGPAAVVNQKDFKQQTSELILLIVPAAAEKGVVTLKTSSGDIISKTQFNLDVTTSVSAMTAEARPGENITITGNFLNWVKGITFAKDITVQTFVSKSLTQIVVKVPEDAQTGPLVLTYGGTDSSEVETADTLKVTLPVATSFSPNPVKHQTNVTITGTNLDLAKKLFFTGVSTAVTTFVSQSATQLVVNVPAGAKKGKLTLEAASGITTLSSTEMDVVLPAVTSMAPNPIDPGADLTVTGTNLDLVTSIAFDNAPPVTSFISHSATQIVVKVPGGVLRGKISLAVLNSTLTVQSNDILEINGSVPPPTMSFPIYNDAVTSNWNGWIGGGWGGTSNRDNTTPVREGTKSVKIDYVGGYGSPLQLGGANINLSPYTSFKISIYGGPGTTGKRINIGINGGDSYTINLVEGKWTDYSIPVSTLTGATALTEIWVKEYSGSGGFTIYVDALGLN
ncbi:MAG: IPT/TIG domain-containing protein [Chitinophagaceae bacterium]